MANTEGDREKKKTRIVRHKVQESVRRRIARYRYIGLHRQREREPERYRDSERGEERKS